MVKNKLRMTLFLFFLIISTGCLPLGNEENSEPETEEGTTLDVVDEKLTVSFLEKVVNLNLAIEGEYEFKFNSNLEANFEITCDKQTGFSLDSYKVIFNEEGAYTFTVTATTKEGKVATDEMVINAFVDLEEPLLTVEENKVDFDINKETYALNYKANKNAKISIVVDKEVDLSDEGMKFLEVGVHKIQITATLYHLSETKEIEVFVYNTLKLFGDGSQSYPWQVSSVDDLAMLSSKILIDDFSFKNNYFKQTTNIDLSGVENWIPIGTIGLPFEGNYDGDNFEINNLTINTSESFQGLFGFVTGIVKNVTVSGEIVVTTNNLPYSHSLVGGIAGGINNGAQIINCVNKINIFADASAGGIVGEVLETDYHLCGEVFSKIINCQNHGKITANFKNAINENTMYFGGIAGKNHGVIENCINYGEVDAETNAHDSTLGNDYVGGITGYSYQPFFSGFGPNSQMNYDAIVGSINYGYIRGSHAVGGIVGQHVLNIKDCINEGNVKGGKSVGGIAGVTGTSSTTANDYTTVINCINKGTITTFDRYAGGIVGYTYDDIMDCKNYGAIDYLDGTYAQCIGGIAGIKVSGYIKGCDNYGNVSGVFCVGGIAGQHYDEILNCNNEGKISGDNCVGGIAGVSGGSSQQNYGSPKIIETTNYGEVIVSTRNAGGVAGMSYGEITNCENHGIIHHADGANTYYVGGISGTKQAGVITNCKNTANVSATASSTVVGGIVGENITGAIMNSINSGNITGIKSVGGIAGRLKDNNYAVTGCESEVSAKISGNDCIGGIAGRIEASLTDKPIIIDTCNNFSIIEGVTGYIGGIVGMHGSHNIVKNCINNGDVSGLGYNDSENIGVGGISGQLFHSSKILNSTNNGQITGERVTGGIAGSAKPNASTPFEINGCINNGIITCNYQANKDAWVGGILGYGSNGAVQDCINNGEIINTNGSKYVNAICGKVASVTQNNNQDLSAKELS